MSAASGLEHLKPFLPGLESALEDSEVSEIMINGPFNVWVERAGRLTAHDAPRLDESALLRAAIHIARPLGLDPASSPIGTVKLSRIRPFCGRILLHQRLRINDLAVAAGGENAAKLLNLTVPLGERVLREFQWEAAGRMPEWRDLLLVEGGTGGD